MNTLTEIQLAITALPARDRAFLRMWLFDLAQWQVKEPSVLHNAAPELAAIQDALVRFTPEQRRQLHEWMDGEADVDVISQLAAHARFPIWSLCTAEESALALSQFIRKASAR